MFDYDFYTPDHYSSHIHDAVEVSGSWQFWTAKRVFDVAVSLTLLPVMLISIVVIFALNPFLNRGTLFFVQSRMGQGCSSFLAIKFRTMTHVAEIVRGHDDPIEVERITVLGKFLRMTRLDEVPQILNVLKGEMSLIGPRPDYYEHAKVFASEISGYRARYSVRPGISGLAQISLGYAEGTEATREKTCADQYYIKNVGFGLDTKIVIGTVLCVLSRAGS